jgi:uncharacterized protein
MDLNQRLYGAMADKAGQVNIAFVCLGLGYTAVTTSDGSVGLAYTYFDHKTGCTLVRDYQDFEGCPASELLPLIKSAAPLERSMALALINALNQPGVRHLAPDRDNRELLRTLDIGPATKVAMVGFFKPFVGLLESMGAKVAIIDEFRAIGDKNDFYRKLTHWADAALITSTAILNNTIEEIINHMGPNVRSALVGPSTPLVGDAFLAWPTIKALAGTVPLETEPVLKAVRHGLGTPYLHRYSKKVTLLTPAH